MNGRGMSIRVVIMGETSNKTSCEWIERKNGKNVFLPVCAGVAVTWWRTRARKDGATKLVGRFG